LQTQIKVATGSIAIGVGVLLLKGAAWWLTGSAALYSDALETVVNVAASVIALQALRVAGRPADRDHPFGHAKAEFLAAGLEGALIVAAAGSILQSAWHAWLRPEALHLPVLGVGLNLAATAVNFGWAQLLLQVGRQTRSPALTGDARHLLADVATSTGIAIGVALVVITGRLWLDAAVAALTAAYVLFSGLRLIRSSAGALMDEALDDGTLAQIQAVIRDHAAGAIEAHDLRTRHAGRSTFLEFHLVVPGTMEVAASHEICDRIEAAFRREMPFMIVNIHVEPEHKAKHQGVIV
jgi:cation diffusion facilitator family transporter